MKQEVKMAFVKDLFLQFFSLLLLLISALAILSGVVIASIGVLRTYVVLGWLDLSSLPSFLSWWLGVVIFVVGVLLVALSIVTSKRVRTNISVVENRT
jgi:hypothetical protein